MLAHFVAEVFSLRAAASRVRELDVRRELWHEASNAAERS
jgi:hypothetical protein